jgi:hypothetical protein
MGLILEAFSKPLNFSELIFIITHKGNLCR